MGVQVFKYFCVYLSLVLYDFTFLHRLSSLHNFLCYGDPAKKNLKLNEYTYELWFGFLELDRTSERSYGPNPCIYPPIVIWIWTVQKRLNRFQAGFPKWAHALHNFLHSYHPAGTIQIKLRKYTRSILKSGTFMVNSKNLMESSKGRSLVLEIVMFLV